VKQITVALLLLQKSTASQIQSTKLSQFSPLVKVLAGLSGVSFLIFCSVLWNSVIQYHFTDCNLASKQLISSAHTFTMPYNIANMDNRNWNRMKTTQYLYHCCRCL